MHRRRDLRPPPVVHRKSLATLSITPSKICPAPYFFLPVCTSSSPLNELDRPTKVPTAMELCHQRVPSPFPSDNGRLIIPPTWPNLSRSTTVARRRCPGCLLGSSSTYDNGVGEATSSFQLLRPLAHNRTISPTRSDAVGITDVKLYSFPVFIMNQN